MGAVGFGARSRTGLYLIVFSIAILILISLGLAVIFGMMRVINLAQGEFIMLGAYVCVLALSRPPAVGSLMSPPRCRSACSACWSSG